MQNFLHKKLYSLLLGMTILAGNSNTAGAWCHLSELNTNNAPAFLVFPVLNTHAIKFCVNVESSRFNAESIALQTSFALKLWIDALAPLAVGEIHISEVKCDDPTKNLVVEVSKKKADWEVINPFTVPLQSNGHYYAFVKINPNFTDSNGGKKIYEIVDFLQFTDGDLSQLSGTLEDISFKKKVSMQKFAKRHRIDLMQVITSTYPTLVHELGHAFGLADTINNMAGCDRSYSSGNKQPWSMMLFPNALYLADDDAKGLLSIFMRFAKKP